MQLTIGLLQHNPTIGAFAANVDAIVRLQTPCDLLLCPEMTLTGYPPQDMLLRDSFVARAQQAAADMSIQLPMPCLLGEPVVMAEDGNRLCYNRAAVYTDGEAIYSYYKKHLPNESVFDEVRYFKSGASNQPHWHWQIDGQTIRVAVLVCQDIWHIDYATEQAQGADMLVCINASPFYCGRAKQRVMHVRELARALAMPVFYVNSVGGQDELVFDGNSLAVNKHGELVVHAGAWREACVSVLYDTQQRDVVPCAAAKSQALEYDDIEDMYHAVCLATRDYVHKTGNQQVWFGLSGGIDSALTACIAADALGCNNVHAVMMPYKYTSELSLCDAKTLSERLGIDYKVLAIDSIVGALLEAMAETLEVSTQREIALQNIQARVRGMLLMTFANLMPRSLVLTTSNKSELSMGYSTLYGDMVGAFNPLKDMTKSQVYGLCRFINRKCEIIPMSTITRPPSAELAPDQEDADSLPAYDVLDDMLSAVLNANTQKALACETQGIWRQIQKNEFKRFQSPPGVRLSQTSLTHLEWRYPIVKGIQDDI